MTLAVVLVLVVVTIVFNRNGLMALARVRGEIETVGDEIDSLRTEVDSLEAEIERLTSDSLYMERAVREILGWGREGEHVIRFLGPVPEGGSP